MTFSPGQKLAHFEIRDLVGSGAMGMVYEAFDPTLARTVALKILPSEFVEHEEFVRRFELEAKVLAAINHPNIAGIYGRHQDDGTDFLALEFVPGENLAEFQAREHLDLSTTIDICRQITEGLEAAHESGVIHRDLKPANVRITPTGSVKILDLGLAKTVARIDTPDSNGSGTEPAELQTRAGSMLGTPAYMSPEQARGQYVDRRTDIWSFGCVLFECLSGQRPFNGGSLFDLLLSIVEDEPDWDALPADTPPSLRAILARCLVKDTERRLRDIGEARIVLTDLAAGRQVSVELPSGPPPTNPPRRRAIWLAAGTAILAIGLWVGWLLGRGDGANVNRLEIVAWDSSWNARLYPAISPDGRHVAYVSDSRLWLCELANAVPRELLEAEGINHPFWSPDAQWIGYAVGNRLLKLPLRGGEPVEIATLEQHVLGVGGFTWGADGTIAFSTGDSDLFAVPADGGAVSRMLAVDAARESDFHKPTWLPDQTGVVFTVHPKDPETRWVETFRQGQRSKVYLEPKQHLEDPVVSPSGYLLFTRGIIQHGVFGLPISLEDLRATGKPFLIAQNGVRPRLAADDLLVFEQRGGPDRHLTWIDTQGRNLGTPIKIRGVREMRLSPDGRRAALNVAQDVWCVDLDRGTMVPLDSDQLRCQLVGWSRTGDEIVFRELTGPGPGRLMRVPADGSRTAHPLGIAEGDLENSAAEGGWLIAYDRRSVRRDNDMVVVRAVPNAVSPVFDLSGVEPFQSTPEREERPRISPDGKLVAYISNKTGANEIFITSIRDGGSRLRVSRSGGRRPCWAQGQLFFYTPRNELMRVAVQSMPTLRLGEAELVVAGNAIGVDFSEGLDVAPDGSRFLVLQDLHRGRRPPRIVVMRDWLAAIDR